MKRYEWIVTILAIVSSALSILGLTVFTIPSSWLGVIVISCMLCIVFCFTQTHTLKRENENTTTKLNKLSKDISKLCDEELDGKEKEYKIYARRIKDNKDKIKVIEKCKKVVLIILILFYVPRNDFIISTAKEAIEIVLMPFYTPEAEEPPEAVFDKIILRYKE